MNRDDILPLLSTLPMGCRLGSPEAKRRDEEYERIREEVRHMDEVELFYRLYCLAVQNEFQTPAGYAVSLLRTLKPTCQMSCEDAIRALLSEWNVSTSTLPFYLVEQFGKARMRDAIKQIRLNSLTQGEKALLGTVEYWVNLANNEDS